MNNCTGNYRHYCSGKGEIRSYQIHAEPIMSINMNLSKIFRENLFETVYKKTPTVVFIQHRNKREIYKEKVERYLVSDYFAEQIYINRLSAKGTF